MYCSQFHSHKVEEAVRLSGLCPLFLCLPQPSPLVHRGSFKRLSIPVALLLEPLSILCHLVPCPTSSHRRTNSMKKSPPDDTGEKRHWGQNDCPLCSSGDFCWISAVCPI